MMFTATLFVIVPNQKQPKSPPVGEWLKQTLIYSCNKILLSNKKEQTTGTHNKIGESMFYIIHSYTSVKIHQTVHLHG